VGVLVAAGCQRGDDTDASPAPVDSRESGPAPDTGDTGPDTASWFFTDVTFAPSGVVPTVVTVSWQTVEPATCTLSYGPTGDLGFTTVEGGPPSTRHEVALVGLAPETTGGLILRAQVGDATLASAEQAFTTGALPVGVPDVEVEIFDPERAFQGFTLMPLIDDPGWKSWICVLDPDGVVVWAYPARHGANRARLAPDGGGILYLDVDNDPESETILGAVYSVAWDGTERWRLARSDLHHDFAILGEDRFVALGTTARDYDVGLPTQRRLRGDTLIEFDSAGNAQVIWDIFDALDPGEIPTTVTGEDPGTGTWDWSHGNYLTWLPERGELLIVFRSLDAIVAVEPDSGDVTWTLSNTWGTYRAPDGATLLDAPHSAEIVDGGLATFSQTVFPFGSDCSWGSILALDAAHGTATETWRYETEDCAQVSYLGSTHPLPNGNELVVFSQAEHVDEVTPEGEVVRRVRSREGMVLAYAHPTLSLQPIAY
jgi:hypothetical protein